MNPALQRAQAFAARHGLRLPVCMAPMAGVTGTDLPLAVVAAGGMGALGALMTEPAAIASWVQRVRERQAAAPLQLNLWIPEPAPVRDAAHEARLRDFLGRFGPPVAPQAGDAQLPDFQAQCEALLAARPTVVSSVMGLFDPDFVQRLKDAGIAWWATATTVSEALQAERAGADAIVAQGAEAGGHRGAFEAEQAQQRAVGLFALLPRVVDRVRVPVVATGGVADARGLAAALLLGASAVQVGTAYLRTPQAGIAGAWAGGLSRAEPEDTRLTRAFSGRWGRSLDTEYVQAAARPDAPEPAPYPVQRGLTAAMRKAAEQADDVQRMQAWSGQAAALAAGGDAQAWTTTLWRDACALLGGAAAFGGPGGAV
jgi:nitronate monooxygenase